MSTHEREHEDWIARIVAGEIDSGLPEVGVRLAACPQCRRQLERLGPLVAGLRTLAEQERADLAHARQETDGTDEELVRRSLARTLGTERPRRRRPVVLGALGLAAAVVLVLLGWAARVFLPGEPAPEILLGGDGVVCLAPIGALSEGEPYEEFLWRYDLPPLGSFTLRIDSLEGDGRGPVLPAIVVKEPRWIPSAEERGALPDRLRWRVEARSASGELLAHGWAEASRR